MNPYERRKHLYDQVKNLHISVKKINYDCLLIESINHYNTRLGVGQNISELGNLNKDTVAKDVLDRIMVNFIRHTLTTYHDELHQIHGKLGQHTAYYLLKRKILDTIKGVYPFLTKECDRQKIFVNW